MSDHHEAPPGVEAPEGLEFMARLEVVTLFALLAVPEDRRVAVLSTLRGMLGSYTSAAPDDSPALADAMTKAVAHLEHRSEGLSRREWVGAGQPDDPRRF